MGDSIAQAKSSSETVGFVRDSWQGISFSLCGKQMVSRLGEVVEVLTLPEYTAFHGAEPWMMGVANIRSQLVTLIDLEAYFGSARAGNKKNIRVLMVDDGFSKIGLVVSKVYGLKNLSAASFKPLEAGSDELLMSCLDAVVSGSEAIGKQNQWYRFSIEKFLNANAIT